MKGTFCHVRKRDKKESKTKKRKLDVQKEGKAQAQTRIKQNTVTEN